MLPRDLFGMRHSDTPWHDARSIVAECPARWGVHGRHAESIRHVEGALTKQDSGHVACLTGLMSDPIEQFAAKAMGTMNAVKAGFNGLRGVFLHLAEEHGEAAALMKGLRKTADSADRSQHWPALRAELLAHERAELAEVYPVLSQYEATRALSTEHNRQAAELEVAIAAVDVAHPASAGWSEAFEHVYALLQRHIAEEESELFPLAQEVVDEDESKAILIRYEAAKKMAKKLL